MDLTLFAWVSRLRGGCCNTEEVLYGVERAVGAVARWGDLTVLEAATDFGVAEETVRRWKRQADIDRDIGDGMICPEQSELVRLCRDKHRLEIEKVILRRAAAYFAPSMLPN